MPSMDIDNEVDIPEFLQDLLENAPEDLQGYFLQFQDLWERKLWKQLTDLLVEFYGRQDTSNYKLKLYNSFISSFDKHISQLKLVSFGIAAAQQYQDQQLALEFMNKLVKHVEVREEQDALVFATIEAARIQLLLGDAETAWTSTKRAGEILDSFDSVDPIIHAAYYRVCADYHKAKAEYNSYYRNALLYLACVKVEDLTLAEAQERAHDLSIAALLGETIYNFGELLLHPILQALEGTPHAWLRPFLSALNSGDIAGFESLSNNVPRLPILEQNAGFLRQKLCLMALLEAIFKRPAHDRILPFKAIATETRLPTHEVEHLLMKALSLKLVRGTIDQVDEVVRINWVQPRVLNLQQVQSMQVRLSEWSQDVKQLESHMQNHSSAFIEVA